MSKSVHAQARKLFAVVALVCLSVFRSFAESNPPGPVGYIPDQLPMVLTQSLLGRQGADQVNQIWGFIGRDYRGKIMTGLGLSFLAFQAFDQETRWPTSDCLPNGFKPQDWLDIAKDPGLGIRRLNRDGVTGRGVSIAVIDKPIRFTHVEFKGRITYTEVFGNSGSHLPNHFHGLACASILGGQSCGVAPEVQLCYFAVPDNGSNFLNYSIAVDRLLEINQRLPKAQKIRLLSISDGRIGPYEKEWNKAKSKLKAAGVELLFPSNETLSGFAFGGCPPFLDRQAPDSYDFSPLVKQNALRNDSIIIPADYRTTASNAGDSIYVYWGQGGWSWAIPYIAGLSALAWQVNPSIRFTQIEKLLRQTATVRPDGSKVLMPAAFIDSVRNR
jgi:serine protease AprX